ncbi:hypothetical protein BKA63DRAFT_372293, partial [Paraphoma chrysanthemicola]
ISRWIAAILAWDFEIKHVPGKRNAVADALSRYPKPEGWTAPDEPEEDIEEFVESLIANMESPSPMAESRTLRLEYSDESEKIAKFLTTLKTPAMRRGQLRAWKKRAMNFF